MKLNSLFKGERSLSKSEEKSHPKLFSKGTYHLGPPGPLGLDHPRFKKWRHHGDLYPFDPLPRIGSLRKFTHFLLRVVG